MQKQKGFNHSFLLCLMVIIILGMLSSVSATDINYNDSNVSISSINDYSFEFSDLGNDVDSISSSSSQNNNFVHDNRESESNANSVDLNSSSNSVNLNDSFKETSSNYPNNLLSSENISNYGYDSEIINDEISTYDYNNLWYVGQNITENGLGTQSDPFNNLKLALDNAGVNDKIFVMGGTYSGINNSNLAISIEGLTIEALPGANVVFSGNNTNRIFQVSGSKITISGLTFIKGQMSNSVSAIGWSGINGTLNNCSFINNTGTQHGGALDWGGAYGLINNTQFMVILVNGEEL